MWAQSQFPAKRYGLAHGIGGGAQMTVIALLNRLQAAFAYFPLPAGQTPFGEIGGDILRFIQTALCRVEELRCLGFENGQSTAPSAMFRPFRLVMLGRDRPIITLLQQRPPLRGHVGHGDLLLLDSP